MNEEQLMEVLSKATKEQLDILRGLLADRPKPRGKDSLPKQIVPIEHNYKCKTCGARYTETIMVTVYGFTASNKGVHLSTRTCHNCRDFMRKMDKEELITYILKTINDILK